MTTRKREAKPEPVDILDRLRDLHRQATVERSHYYVGRCVSDAINEITTLRKVLGIVEGMAHWTRSQRTGERSRRPTRRQ